MLKVPTPQSVRRDVSLEISNVSQSDRRQRPCSSASSRLSFRQPELNMEHFQPVVFCCLKRENKPRIWFIKLMSWPYPLCDLILHRLFFLNVKANPN